MSMTYYGEGNITAELIKHSTWEKGQDLYTFRLVYPRFIHGEVMTHRVFSRNAASSRAIPINAMMAEIKKNPAHPIHWGENQRGMQADKQVNADKRKIALTHWLFAFQSALYHAESLRDLGVHKQVVNRLLEPFMFMTTIVTTTHGGLNNFFNLRLHKDAQPEIYELARLMDYAVMHSTPDKLECFEWHAPFVDSFRDGEGSQVFIDENGSVITFKQAIHIAVSACAQVSFRKNDLSLEKAERIYKMLVGADVVHASPFEHVAFAMEPTNKHRSNLIGWTQYRKLIDNEYNDKWERTV